MTTCFYFSFSFLSVPLLKVATVCGQLGSLRLRKAGRIFFSFFPPYNSALSCQLSRMKAVPVYEVLYRGKGSLSPPQTDRSRLNVKLYVPVHTALPRQPDLTVTPHKVELEQQGCV